MSSVARRMFAGYWRERTVLPKSASGVAPRG
jgi:hypothetical protein